MTRRLCALLVAATCPFLWAQDDATKRPRRGESFFGLHFDRHLGREDRGVGRTLTAPMIESLLDAARPDFIQVDTKGHPGIASYPTRWGTSAAELERDPLKLFREVTARRGVSLYSHYSGVIDRRAIELHPDWAVVNLDGSRSRETTSFYSPYADRILIPQLKELADYGVDGAWVDGDSWGTKPDFRDEAKAEFRATTGLEPPKTTDDPSYVPYLEFTRTKFKQYVRRPAPETVEEGGEAQATQCMSPSPRRAAPLRDMERRCLARRVREGGRWLRQGFSGSSGEADCSGTSGRRIRSRASRACRKAQRSRCCAPWGTGRASAPPRGATCTTSSLPGATSAAST